MCSNTSYGNAKCMHELLSFQPPPPSSRPPVIGYKISHNTSGSVLTNQTNETMFSIEGMYPRVYLFDICAFNILGDGIISSIFGIG